MEIRLYDPNMDFLGVTENQTSLLWTRRYFEPGEFELHAPVTPYNVGLLKLNNLVWMRGAAEAGVIEDVKTEQNNIKNEITVKGRFLESYMDRRLIRPTLNYSGLTEVAMRTILSNIQVPIPKVQLGELNGYDETITFQATYKNLMEYETKLAKSALFGYRFRPDFTNKTITFEIYKGIDHSRSQTDRNWVEFSESYKNVSSASSQENSQLYKNVCYVGGQGEGSERVWVTVGDDTLVGLDRREVYRNASDVSRDDVSYATYVEELRQRGYQELEEDSIAYSFETTTTPRGNFNYKENYDLGDIVTIKKENWGLSVDLRLSAITEVYEHGTATIQPTFGSPLPETIDWEDKV